jgi:hypothetical protein
MHAGIKGASSDRRCPNAPPSSILGLAGATPAPSSRCSVLPCTAVPWPPSRAVHPTGTQNCCVTPAVSRSVLRSPAPTPAGARSCSVVASRLTACHSKQWPEVYRVPPSATVPPPVSTRRHLLRSPEPQPSVCASQRAAGSFFRARRLTPSRRHPALHPPSLVVAPKHRSPSSPKKLR